MSDDRRRRIRVPLQQMIRHSRYQVLGTPVFEENSSLDLSSGGMSFETAQEYKTGTLVLLELSIEGEAMKLLICIAWTKPGSEPGRYQVGGELIAIDPEHKKTMQAHVQKLIRYQDSQQPRKKKAGKKKPGKKASKKSAKKNAKKSAKKNSKKKTIKKKASKKKSSRRK